MRTSKTDSRLAAYADVDEANSSIGVALSLGDLEPELVTLLTGIQNNLFDVGADLCTPVSPNPEHAPLRIEPSDVTRLEGYCDRYNSQLEPLRSFILPGGSAGAALLHVARTTVRRAERTTWLAVHEHGPSMNALPAQYLNRLSDLLFILCRYANRETGDVLWVPGGERER